MAVRNYWIEAKIDGRKTLLTGGPEGKQGGFFMRIHMRAEGGVNLMVTELELRSQAETGCHRGLKPFCACLITQLRGIGRCKRGRAGFTRRHCNLG